jgi:hypothetical protein
MEQNACYSNGARHQNYPALQWDFASLLWVEQEVLTGRIDPRWKPNQMDWATRPD